MTLGVTSEEALHTRSCRIGTQTSTQVYSPHLVTIEDNLEHLMNILTTNKQYDALVSCQD
jgi:hypothetical protein